MKFQFNDKKKIVISLDTLTFEGKSQFVEIFNELYIYIVSDKKVICELYKLKNVICYLDYFILVLPSNYNEQQIMWRDFYEYFGENYELIIDKKNNIECIEMMLKYIEKEKKASNSCRILDYGCGSGISILANYKGEIWGYEPVERMRNQAKSKGMKVFFNDNLEKIPNNFFDAIFSSYVFHMAVNEEDIKRIFSKAKKNAFLVANFYKNINESYVNDIFMRNGFEIRQVKGEANKFGSVYVYRRK